MRTATDPSALADLRDELQQLYPGAWGACLIPLCEPRAHTHPAYDGEKEEWVEEACDSPGKRPIGRDWNGKAMLRLQAQMPPVSSDAEQQLDQHIRDIAKRIADGGNVGLVMPTGTMALDFDDAKSVDGAEHTPELQDAPRQLTKKGAHLVTQAPPEAAGWPQDTKLELSNGMTVDLRLAERGQIVAAPSAHVSGCEYHWDRELPPKRADLPMLSEGLVGMIDKAVRAKKRKAETTWDAADGKIGVGDRQGFFLKECGKLINKGLRGAPLYVALNAINIERCDPPWEDDELRTLVANASEKWESNGTGPSNESDSDQADDSKERPKQVDQLLKLLDQVSLFHTPSGDTYVDLMIESHRETHKIRSGRFAQWLRREFRAGKGGSADPGAISQAVEESAALALDEGDERDVHVRNARGADGAIYLDLGDDSWNVISIDANGWQIVESTDIPVRFRRPKALRPLPLPERGGSIDELRALVNVASDDDFKLVVAFLLGVLHPDGPYAFLSIRGPQGSAKTTAGAILQNMIDPTATGPSAMPSNQRDAVIVASSGHMLNFDNVSTITPWLSDFLSRLSTGASSAYRALYTDDELALFTGRNPVLLNGITSIVERPDLAERSIFITLEPIEKSKRRLEREVWEGVEKIRPRILSALLDAAVHGIRHLPETKLDELPRMADFALWVTACEGALWEPGDFITAYLENQRGAVAEGIADSPVSSAILDLMKDRSEPWSGTCQELLDALDKLRGFDGDKRPPSEWPKSPQKISKEIDRASAPLRSIGIAITRAPRRITIERR